MSMVIDVQDLMSRVQNDKELLLELFDIFQEDFPVRRNAFWQAFEAGNVTLFQQLAHGLKGATGNISAKQMHENCTELDRIARDGVVSQAKPRLELLDQQYAAFQAEVARIKQELQG